MGNGREKVGGLGSLRYRVLEVVHLADHLLLVGHLHLEVSGVLSSHSLVAVGVVVGLLLGAAVAAAVAVAVGGERNVVHVVVKGEELHLFDVASDCLLYLLGLEIVNHHVHVRALGVGVLVGVGVKVLILRVDGTDTVLGLLNLVSGSCLLPLGPLLLVLLDNACVGLPHLWAVLLSGEVALVDADDDVAVEE